MHLAQRVQSSLISRKPLLFLLGRLALGFDLLFSLLGLLIIGTLRIPLPSLKNKHADEHESEDCVAGSQDLEAILPAEHNLTLIPPLTRMLPLVLLPHAICDGAQASNRVGGVDGEGDKVEDEAGAVEEEVGLAGAPHLDEDADKDDEEHDVQHAADERWRIMHELEVRLVLVEVGRRSGRLVPEQREVVGEHGKEDAEEEERR